MRRRQFSNQRRYRRRVPRLLAVVAVAALLAAGQTGVSLGSEHDAIKVGLLVPQSGVYQAAGDDARNGFELYLELHDGKLGGRTVDLVIADEGQSAETGKAAGEKLVKQEEVDVLAGAMSSFSMHTIKDMVQQEELPLVGTNSSPTTIDDYTYIWRTSFANDDAAVALGEYVAENVDGSVYLVAADYAAGKEYLEGFKKTFLPAGGEVAGELYTPFPDTTNYQPFLSKIQQSGAKAVFCFYAGGAAVEFVKQFHQFGLKDAGIALYSPGYLTEGDAQLAPQGDAALGIYTSQNYAPDLDNAANEQFVAEYVERFETEPTTYAMTAYDAAAVLDKAIAAAGDDLSGARLNEEIGKVGQIESPRGTWEFNDRRTPVQTWYLREVREVDGAPVNVTIGELARLGE